MEFKITFPILLVQLVHLSQTAFDSGLSKAEDWNKKKESSNGLSNSNSYFDLPKNQQEYNISNFFVSIDPTASKNFNTKTTWQSNREEAYQPEASLNKENRLWDILNPNLIANSSGNNQKNLGTTETNHYEGIIFPGDRDSSRGDFRNSNSFIPSKNPVDNHKDGTFKSDSHDESDEKWDGKNNSYNLTTSQTTKSKNKKSEKLHRTTVKPARNNSKKKGTDISRSKGSNSKSPWNLLGEDSCGLDLPRRILGGTTTDIDEFPWLCLLQYYDLTGKVTQDCSGTLISRRYVVTAAHCTHGPAITRKSLKLRKVVLGEWDTATEKDCQGQVCSAPLQVIDVEDIIPHENYKPRGKSQNHDIALIRLRDPAVLNNYVQPICLPFNKFASANYEDKKLTVSGWGRTSNARDSSSTIKMKVDVPVVNWERCRQFYESFYGNLKISSTQICAGGEEGKDSCQGDSGGPLMSVMTDNSETRWFLIGIVSSGPAACGVEDRPSLYTNVSQYTNWILENIKN